MKILEIELLKPQYGLLVPKELIFCLDFPNGDRVYFTSNFLENQKEAGPGVTEVYQNSSGSAPFLMNWSFKNGVTMAVMGQTTEEANLMTQEARDYGTFFHGLIAKDFIPHGFQYDPLHLPETIEQFYFSHECRYNQKSWAKKTKRHLVSFCQWITDYDIEFLAVELPVFLRTMDDPDDHNPDSKKEPFYMGSRIDLVCRSHKPGKFDGTLWIVDMKTGEKSYKAIQEYEYQLSFYRLMLLANFPEFQHEEIRLFNWSPKSWNCRSHIFYHFEQRNTTPFSILAGLAEKFWYEKGENFLTRKTLTFSDNPITPSVELFQYQTYAGVIQRYLQEEQT